MTTNNTKALFVCLAAGGTGGHVLPALAVAEQLQAQGHQILILTDQRGVRLIPEHLPFKIAASASPFAGSVFKRGLAIMKLAVGLIDILRQFAKQRPDIVVGFGGYPAAAPVFAAWCLKIPALMHEQNAVIGRTNLLLSKFVKALMVSWPNSQPKPEKTTVILTGLPVRPSFEKISPYKVKAKSPSFELAILGGSLGAALFSELIPEALVLLPADLRTSLKITQQVRSDQKDQLDAFYKDHRITARTSSFFDDVGDIMQSSDLIISRSGASSVTEIAHAGRPAIFIPFARALDDHQTKNAAQLCDKDGAIMLAETSLSSQRLSEKIAELMQDNQQRLRLAKNARAQAQTNACEAIVKQVISAAAPKIKEAA